MKYFLIFQLFFCFPNYSQQPAVDSIKIISKNYRIVTEISADSKLHSILFPDSSSIVFVDSTGTFSRVTTKGDTLWENEVFGTIDRNALIRDQQLIFSTEEGDLFSFDLTNGDQIISIGLDESITHGPYTFNYNSDSEEYNSRYTKGDAILISISNGNLIAYDINTLEEIWTFNDAKEKILSNLLIVRDKAVYTNDSGHFYCVDLKKGWLIWKWKLPKKIKSPFLYSDIISDGKFIYFVLSDKRLYKVDLLLGKILWRSKRKFEKSKISIINKKSIFVSGAKKKLLIMNTSNGKVIHSINYPEKDFSITTKILKLDNSLIFGSAEGFLYELENKKIHKIFDNHKTSIKLIKKIDRNMFFMFSKNMKIYIIEKL